MRSALNAQRVCEIIAARDPVSNAVKRVLSLHLFGGVGPKSPILGRFPAQPGPGGAWERPRLGHRSIGIDFQAGKP